MASTVEELQLEEETKKKIRQKKRVRGVLVAVNLLLVSYFGYLAVAGIVEAVQSSINASESDTLLLQGKNKSDSLALYEAHLENKGVDIADFATYGKYLLTSQSRVTSTNINYSSEVVLSDISSNPYTFRKVENTYKGSAALGDKLNEQVDLFKLDAGDYVLYDSISDGNQKGTAYHYTGENLRSETLYSFPNIEGYRKKITLKGKASSPAFLVSVERVSYLPTDYYDLVVIGDHTSYTTLDTLESNHYKIKYVSSLKEAYLTSSSYCLNVVEGDQVTSSQYVNLEGTNPSTSITSSGIYNSLDSDNAIRELGGYIFNAGYGVTSEETSEDIASSSLEIKNVIKDSHVGKFTLTVGNEVPLETIKNLLEISK